MPDFRSPISHGVPGTSNLRLTDETGVRLTLLRGSDEPPFGRSEWRDDTLWVGIRPGEVLLVGRAGPPAGVTVVDLTHGRAALRLAGARAAAHLARFCSIDLRDDMTPPGAVVSAMVAEVSCDLVRDDVDDVPTYLVMCDRSYGAWLFDALAP